MKNLSNLVLEEEFINKSYDDILLTEGFWNKLGKLFGKTKTYPEKIQKDFRDGYTAALVTAAKSKDKDDKEGAKKTAEAANKGDKELLKTVKAEVERLDRVWDRIKLPDYSYAQYKLLKELSDKLNDEEGKKQAENFHKIIDKKFPKASDKQKELEKKIEKANVTDEKPKDDKKDDKKSEEVKTEVTDTIKDNKDILGSLAKEAEVDGDKLRSYVVKLLNNEKEKPEESYILGTCVCVCGALITKDEQKFHDICELIQVDSPEELKKEISIHKDK